MADTNPTPPPDPPASRPYKPHGKAVGYVVLAIWFLTDMLGKLHTLHPDWGWVPDALALLTSAWRAAVYILESRLPLPATDGEGK